MGTQYKILYRDAYGSTNKEVTLVADSVMTDDRGEGKMRIFLTNLALTVIIVLFLLYSTIAFAENKYEVVDREDFWTREGCDDIRKSHENYITFTTFENKKTKERFIIIKDWREGGLAVYCPSVKDIESPKKEPAQ